MVQKRGSGFDLSCRNLILLVRVPARSSPLNHRLSVDTMIQRLRLHPALDAGVQSVNDVQAVTSNPPRFRMLAPRQYLSHQQGKQ